MIYTVRSDGMSELTFVFDNLITALVNSQIQNVSLRNRYLLWKEVEKKNYRTRVKNSWNAGTLTNVSGIWNEICCRGEGA
jgi:hypothetical protein